VPERVQSFGYWLRRRRKALDLTQGALAQRVFCSAFSIRKIEADERRPSRALAERLAKSLAIPDAERRQFLAAARAAQPRDQPRLDGAPIDDAGVHGKPLPAVRPSSIGLDDTPFVGRTEEYRLLSGLISQLTAGRGYTVLLEGEPGIGKSRLLREITRYADRLGLSTLASNCYEIERATPYQPVIELVTRALDRASDVALRQMTSVSLAELAALVPEIAERMADLPRLSSDFPEARQARLARAVSQLLEAASGGRPWLLVVDDIQWSDEASAQVLHLIARQAGTRPVLVIYAYRDENADSDERLAQLLESLRRDASARRLVLARLDHADTERLVALVAAPNIADGAFIDSLHRETEGNPFFLMSILQSTGVGEALISSRRRGEGGVLPDALRAAVRARLVDVPKDIRSALEAAAVLGRRFDFDTLVEVTADKASSLFAAMEWLLRRRLIHEDFDGGVYDFSHDKVREVVYLDIGGARRRALHQAVAEALERREERETPERSALLAEHFERAQVWAKALRYLVAAAEHSQALFALRDALHWLDRAVILTASNPRLLEESERAALYGQRGAIRAQAGQVQGAVADLRSALEVFRSHGERAKIRDALIHLGMAYRRADAYDEANACLTEALAESRAMHDERQTADTLYHLGTTAWSNGRNDKAIEFHQQAVEICEQQGFSDLAAVQAYHGRGEAYFASAEPAAAIACFTRSLDLARVTADKSYESENLMMIGHACTGSRGLGDYARATAHLEAALDIARAADLQWHLGPTLLGRDHVRACTGSYGEAWHGFQQTLSRLESLHQVRYQLMAYDYIGQLLLDLNLNERALEQLQCGLALGHDTGIMFYGAAIEADVAIARARLGNRDVLTSLNETLARTRRACEHYQQVRCLNAMAEISLATADTAGCRTFADELLTISVRNGLRELEAYARRWRGAAWLADGDYADAQTELTRASTLAAEVGRMRLRMDAEAALASLCAKLGQNDAARHHGHSAHGVMQAIENSLISSGLEARLRGANSSV
jgi:tetratricopeptide (TPR) repeat protein/transcriptional regulator with XRE-family HTH domain